MRKGRAQKRKVIPDPVYNSTLVTRAINTIMLDGKKSIARNIFYQALKLVEKKTSANPLEVFNKAVENAMPRLELRVRRMAGANYQVPAEVSEDRRISLALRWLVLSARKRNEKSMIQCFANEVIDAFHSSGATIKKRDDTHKMAESNKIFAYLR